MRRIAITSNWGAMKSTRTSLALSGGSLKCDVVYIYIRAKRWHVFCRGFMRRALPKHPALVRLELSCSETTVDPKRHGRRKTH